MFDCNPVTDNGEDAPEAVNDPGEDVTVKDVAAGEFAGKANATSARPLLYSRLVPTFDALEITGGLGSKKSFDAFGFTPWGGPSCVHEDTLIRTPNGDVAAKDVKVDDFITSIGIQEIALEGLTSSDYDWRSVAIPTATNTGIVEVRVTASEESTVQEVVWFNGESNTKFSLDHPMFLKGDPNYVFILAGFNCHCSYRPK